jgi:tetratricopeptide (TPR) repeat protein
METKKYRFQEWLMKIYQNLLARDYSKLVGREDEIKKIMQFLSPDYGLNIVTVDGIGGVGKTALVLEVAQRCLEASLASKKKFGTPTFDAIIFISAKQNVLTSNGIIPLYQTQRTMRDLIKEIAVTLDCADVLQVEVEEQPLALRKYLASRRVLLIVDNLETIEEKQGVMSFLYQLPTTVKVIITTREREIFAPVRLLELSEKYAIELVHQRAVEMNASLTTEEERQLARITGGVPAAIVYSVGQIAAGYSIKVVTAHVRDAKGDIARFCFENSVKPLRGGPAHNLLMAISMFPKSPTRESLFCVADYSTDPISADEGLMKLQKLSLIAQIGDRYRMLPLTREYALAELAAFQDFERTARENWIKYYIEFVNKNGGDAYQVEWHIQYDKLEGEWENIQEVLNWCAQQDRYSDFKSILYAAMPFTRIYGYWSDHLVFTEWLVEASERRGDLSTLTEQLYQKGWILQRMGELESALSIYDRAWKLRDHVDNKSVVVKIANRIAQTELSCDRLDSAYRWTVEAENAVQQIEDEDNRKREIMHVVYTRALVWQKTGKFDDAIQNLHSTMKDCQSVNWQRGLIWGERMIADLMISKREFGEARKILETDFPIVCRNKDRRGIALYKRSFALLEYGYGDREKALIWARQALGDFENLGMIREAIEMKGLVQSIDKRPV